MRSLQHLLLCTALAACSTGPATPDTGALPQDTMPRPAAPAPTDISGTRWVLYELNGQPVMDTAFNEPHLTFNAADSTVAGNGGCNHFFGPCALSAHGALRFGDLMTTEMACPGLATEDALYEVLRQVDNYTYANDTLSLNKARMAPLARFKAQR